MARSLVLLVLGVIAWSVVFCHAQTTQGIGGGTIIGKAVDAEGKGVEQTSVSVFPADKEAKALATVTTGDDGAFTFTSIPAGDGYRIEAVKTGGLFTKQAAKQGVKVVAGAKADVGPMELKIGAKTSQPATGPTSAEETRDDAPYLTGDAAWDRYNIATIQFQRDLARLVLKQHPEMVRVASAQRDLQLAMRELGGLRMRYLLKNDPGRLDRTHGIANFVNFGWGEEDTARLEKADPAFVELKKRIDELKKQSGLTDESRQFFAKLQESDEFKVLLDKMQAEMAEAEKLLPATATTRPE